MNSEKAGISGLGRCMPLFLPSSVSCTAWAQQAFLSTCFVDPAGREQINKNPITRFPGCLTCAHFFRLFKIPIKAPKGNEILLLKTMQHIALG